MVDALVPRTRAIVPEARVRTSRVVSAEEWGGASELALWVQGSGGVALPSHHVGLEIDTVAPMPILDTSLTSASYGWWREATVSCAILVTGHRENVIGGYGARLTLSAGDGTVTFGSWEIRFDNNLPQQPRAFTLRHFDLPARAGPIRLLVTAQANTTGLFVDLVQVIEEPRSKLVLGVADHAVLPASCGAHSPIYDVQHLSARGAVDAYLHADWRRQGYFHHGLRENPILIVDDGLVELFPFGIPMQAQVRAPGDGSSTEVVVAIEAQFDNGGSGSNTASLKVATDKAAGSEVRAVPSGASWATYVLRVEVATEDLDSADGRRASVWELMHISAELDKVTGAPELRIGTIGVFGANAEGEAGFTTSDRYTQALTAALAGSDTMTRSVLFRIDAASGSTRTLLEHLVTGQGWALRVLASGALEWRIRNGGGDYVVTSAALVVGRTYVATASWDGANLRLVVNQVASTPVAGSGFAAPTTGAAGLGADSAPSSPASDCTILGVAASDTIALNDAAMLAHNKLCAAVADMRPFAACEHLYSARFGLHVDLLGEAHWTIVGTPTRERFVPRMG